MSDINVQIIPEETVSVSIGGEIVSGALSGTIPTASATVLGGVKVGQGLKVSSGVLSVDAATAVEQDNTKPVTSAAVHTQIGNIAALLAAL